VSLKHHYLPSFTAGSNSRRQARRTAADNCDIIFHVLILQKIFRGSLHLVQQANCFYFTFFNTSASILSTCIHNFTVFLKQLPAVLGKIRKTAKKLLPNFPFSCILYKQHYDGPLAQLVEHLTLNQGVVGSRPTWVTKIWPVGQAVKTPPFHGGIRGSIPLPVTIRALSSAGRASALQAECRRFDPVSAHQKSGISKKLGYAFFI
jgi:hypothetical protein